MLERASQEAHAARSSRAGLVSDDALDRLQMAEAPELETFFDIDQLFRHLKTVERIIGHKSGTGGSSGVPFLKKALEHTFFPELIDVRTAIGVR